MSALVASGRGSRHGADIAVGTSAATFAKLRTFHTLDALRGIAALTVVLVHTAFIYGIKRPAGGQFAVDLFFVMSGFIIAYRYEDDLYRGMGFARFVKVRLIRLYPLFILGAILGAVPALLAIVSGDVDPFHEGMLESFPLAVFMLPSRFAMPRLQELYPLNYVAWSLALEILVNIVYAATFRYWTVRRLVVAMVAGFLGLCAGAAVCGSLRYGYDWYGAWVGPFRIIYGFAAGILIYRVFRSRPFILRVPWWLLIVAAAALFLFDAPVVKPAWEVIAVTFVVPAIVVAAIVNEPPKAFQGACAISGIFSYVIYSLHAPFVGFFLRGEDRLHLDHRVQSPREALVFTVLLVLLCVAAHLFYDRPVRRVLTRWFTSQRRLSPSLTAEAAVK